MNLYGSFLSIGKQNGTTIEQMVLNRTLLNQKNKGILRLVLDLSRQKIYFEDGHEILTEDTLKDYFIVKHKTGNSSQYYLARDWNPERFRYFADQNKRLSSGKCFSEVFTKTYANIPSIRAYIDLCCEIGIMEKNDNYAVYMSVPENAADVLKDNKYCCIITVVKDGKKEIILSQLRDYKKFVLNQRFSSETSVQKKTLCHLCGETRVLTEMPFQDRTAVTQLFTKTDAYLSYNLNKEFHKMFWICSECAPFVLNGSNIVHENYLTLIPNDKKIKTLVLPEKIGAVGEVLDYERIIGMAKSVFEIQEERIEEQLGEGYAVSFIIYETDGQSARLIGTIEDVPVLRIVYLRHLINKIRPYFLNTGVSLNIIGSLYNTTNPRKDRVSASEILWLYKSLLLGYSIDPLKLMSVFSRNLAFECRNKSSVNKLINDLYDTISKALIILHIFWAAGCIEEPLFKGTLSEEDGVMYTGEKKNLREKIENYLEERKFTDEQKALFYLGRLLRKAVKAQQSNKTLLDSFPFFKFEKDDIVREFVVIAEKLKEHNKLDESSSLIAGFTEHFQNVADRWEMSSEYAVFFTMAGYSAYIPDLGESSEENKEEVEANADHRNE